MAGRTLLQQALPVTFGLKAAGWLVALVEAARRASELRLPVQLGGAPPERSRRSATPASACSPSSPRSSTSPSRPCRGTRPRGGSVGELAGALSVAAGAVGKAALDIVLLAQTEVAEVAEGAGGGCRRRCRTSATRPRPSARAPARCAPGGGRTVPRRDASTTRARGGCLAGEWEPLREALALTGGAAAAMRECSRASSVDAARMRANLDATGGLLLAERVMFAIASRAGRDEASTRRRRPASASPGTSFRDALLAQPVVAGTCRRRTSSPARPRLPRLRGAFVDRALALAARG